MLLSAESIGIELLTTRLSLSPLAVAGNSIMIAGTALLAITAAVKKRETMSVFREWKVLVPASILVALGVYFWYDAVEYVGASKEGLLSGPLEVIVILVLARLFLRERLGRFQTTGAIIALIGFFAAVLSAGSVELLFTWGDAEAVLSALSFATGIIFLTRLAAKHLALQVTGASLFISGLVLAAMLWSSAPSIGADDWIVLSTFSLLPLAAALTYVVGLSRIGASMTSVIASFSILLTILFQLALLRFGIDAILPSNVALAIAGGTLGVLGIFLIHQKRN